MAKNGSEIIKKHLQLATEFLEDAQTVLKLDRFRSAADRAYYSMYHSAAAALFSKGISTKSHKGLHMMFRKEFITPGTVAVEFWGSLIHAFELRQQSDYDIAATLDENNVEQVVEKAKEFVQEIKGLLNDT